MDSGKSDGEDSQSDGEEAAFQLWDTKRKITSYLMTSMKADADLMVVLVFSEDNTCYMRSDLSRFDLLVECRKSVPETAHTGGTPLHLGHTHGAMLQLRDIRALQDVQHPSFMVRIGAILVSIEPLNAIITRDRAFVIVPDGADDLLEPLMNRLRHKHSDPQAQEVAFEFLALEALLVTLVTHHKQEVRRCEAEAAVILKAIRKAFSSKLLNKILLLKRSIETILRLVQGTQAALEGVQQDRDQLALMFLSRHRQSPSHGPQNREPASLHNGSASIRGDRSQVWGAESRRGFQGANAGNVGYYDVVQAEVLLDAYALEFEGLTSSLRLLEKEIDATEDYLQFKLDTARNKLIRLDVLLGIVGTWLAFSQCITGFYGMNLSYGAYTDGTVKPGHAFEPPTGGTFYDGPFGEYGASWSFFVVSMVSSVGTVVMIALTCCCLRGFGLLRI